MSKLTFGERHIVKGLDPVADAFAGTVYTDVVNLENYHAARFVNYHGVGATGTRTLTIEACDNAAGDNPVAIPFAYQRYEGADDVPADVATASAAGFATVAGSSRLYVLEVDAQDLPEGKTWLRQKSVEVVDSPVLGGVLIELCNPRYGAHVPATAIA
jgi:hypothetical protein